MRPNYVIEDPRDKMSISFLRQVNKQFREEDEAFYKAYVPSAQKRKSFVLANGLKESGQHVYKGANKGG